ncbi:MAG: class I SAM-dependent methyltransferase [Candidatus Lokiarchaeota archaeon]|nr:class I SAM-dependent methyltransferase [Candidatus Lokiarchaeota archaeon]
MKENSKNWDDLESIRDYLDNANIIIQDRKTLLFILKIFYQKYIFDGKPKKILDLGTGNGILIKTLIQNSSIENEIRVVDGSDIMIREAQSNLNYLSKVRYYKLDFQEIINNGFPEKDFDFIVSSFAIHHLELEKKREFYKIIFNLLRSNGYFINIDTTTSKFNDYTRWYLDLWSEWIKNYQIENNTDTSYEDIPYSASNSHENHYDPLTIQLDYLKKIGFSHVECFYKFGLFSIFGGKKII